MRFLYEIKRRPMGFWKIRILKAKKLGYLVHFKTEAQYKAIHITASRMGLLCRSIGYGKGALKLMQSDRNEAKSEYLTTKRMPKRSNNG